MQYAVKLYGANGEKGVKNAGKATLDRDFVEVFDDFDEIPATISARIVSDIVTSDANVVSDIVTSDANVPGPM